MEPKIFISKDRVTQSTRKDEKWHGYIKRRRDYPSRSLGSKGTDPKLLTKTKRKCGKISHPHFKV